jgi:hypothetical protein
VAVAGPVERVVVLGMGVDERRGWGGKKKRGKKGEQGGKGEHVREKKNVMNEHDCIYDNCAFHIAKSKK